MQSALRMTKQQSVSNVFRKLARSLCVSGREPEEGDAAGKYMGGGRGGCDTHTCRKAIHLRAGWSEGKY